MWITLDLLMDLRRTMKENEPFFVLSATYIHFKNWSLFLY